MITGFAYNILAPDQQTELCNNPTQRKCLLFPFCKGQWALCKAVWCRIVYKSSWIIHIIGFRVPGEIKRSRGLRGGRWSWTLKFAQKRSWVGRWSWAEQVGPLLLRVVQVVHQQQCNGHCLCDCPSTAVETAIAQSTSRWAMTRGHRLNTSIVLAAVHGLSGLFRAVSAVETSLCRPLPTLSPPLIGHLASVGVKQHESTE